MQEMVELSKQQSSDTLPQAVKFTSGDDSVILSAGPAHFGRQLSNNDQVLFTIYRSVFQCNLIKMRKSMLRSLHF